MRRSVGARTGRGRADDRDGARSRERRKQPLHGGCHAGCVRRSRGSRQGDGPLGTGNREHRLRAVHARAVLRRHGPRHPIPLRSGHGRDACREQPRHHGVDAKQGSPLPALLRPPGIPDRRALPILGRSGGGDMGRRPGARREPEETLRTRRHRDPLRVARGVSHRGGRCGAGRGGARHRRSVPGARARRRARVRRLRVECRVAHPVPGPGLGSRAGAGEPIQRGRRYPHGARSRGDVVRELVGMPLRGVGSKRTGVR